MLTPSDIESVDRLDQLNTIYCVTAYWWNDFGLLAKDVFAYYTKLAKACEFCEKADSDFSKRWLLLEWDRVWWLEVGRLEINSPSVSFPYPFAYYRKQQQIECPITPFDLGVEATAFALLQTPFHMRNFYLYGFSDRWIRGHINLAACAVKSFLDTYFDHPKLDPIELDEILDWVFPVAEKPENVVPYWLSLFPDALSVSVSQDSTKPIHGVTVEQICRALDSLTQTFPTS